MIELIEQLKSDHKHGSKEVALIFLYACRDWCVSHEINYEQFLYFLSQLSAARPSMAIIQNISRRLSSAVTKDNADLSCCIIDEIDKLLNEMELSNQLIFEKTNALCQQMNIRTVLTHSQSSTVKYVLKQLGKSGTLSSLICTESRPLNEGISLANALSTYLDTTIIVDMLADSIIEQCDCVLLGADAMDQHGNIVNKIGSRLLALSAKDHRIPVICLAESMKVITPKGLSSIFEEFHSATELGHDLNSNVSVINQYFEVIENRLISKIISDHNITS